jgi:TonB family protein
MSSPTGLWKSWEGRVVDEKFPLRQWLGSSDHSAVFLTGRTGSGSQKAVIKVIPAQGLDEDAQLSRWASAAKLSHPHLIHLFECGRSVIDGTRLLYVVMEYAEENLAEILPLRPLSAEEVSEMLPPAAEALAYLHQSGFAHGRIRPSNIMAVDNQLKISADGLAKTGDHTVGRSPSAYDAPELASSGLSPAADVWSLGVTLVAVMTQHEPTAKNVNQVFVPVPETIPQPVRGIALRCLPVDPQQRCTVADILSQLRTPSLPRKVPFEARAVEVKTAEQPVPQTASKRWIIIPVAVAALLLAVWAGSKFKAHPPAVPAAVSRPIVTPPPAEKPPQQSPAPSSEESSEKEKPAQTSVVRGSVRGSVLQQVLPDVSRNAQNTVTGHVKVSVQVSVDASGNVAEAKFTSAGPSKYFADRALAAARRWKFTPPQVDGQAAASEWILRFQFGRTGTQVQPSETNP